MHVYVCMYVSVLCCVSNRLSYGEKREMVWTAIPLEDLHHPPPQTFSLMEILKKQKWHLYLLLCVAGCSDVQHVSEQCESLSSHHKWYLLMSNLFFNTTQIPSLCGLGGSHAQNYFSTSWVWCVRVLYLKKIHSFIHSSSVCWGFTLWMVLF